MTAIDSIFKIIEILRRINKERQRIAIREGVTYYYDIYKRISLLFRSLTKQTGDYSDLFFMKLRCEIQDEHKYNAVISLLIKEIDAFETWYLSNVTLIDSLFSYEAISKAIEKEVDFKYGKERKGAEDEYNEINEDEKVWHSLARAYGSRSSCGNIHESQFSSDDWNYIRPSLDAFKEHFKIKEVNLPEMYKDYEQKLKPKLKECSENRDEVLRKYETYRSELEHELEDDVYAKIQGHLATFNGFLVNESREIVGGKNMPNDSVEQKTGEKYGRYKDLAECIPRDDIYKKVVEIADSYYKKHGSIDGVFGNMLMVKLKGDGLLSDRGCTQAHFGELIIKEFGTKCSFKAGGAISDAKGRIDPSFGKMLEDAFKTI